jgi:hypothetical protein
VTSRVGKRNKNQESSSSFAEAAHKSWKTLTHPKTPSIGLDDLMRCADLDFNLLIGRKVLISTAQSSNHRCLTLVDNGK